MNQIAEEVEQILGIQHRLTTAYHPESNGMVERFNGTLKEMLRSYVDDDQADWDLYLHWCCFAYRSSPIKDEEYSPFLLLQGREPRSVLDIDVRSFQLLEHPTEWARRMMHHIRRIREIVSEQRIRNRKQLQNRTRGGATIRYHQGDLVLVKKMSQKPGVGRSLGV